MTAFLSEAYPWTRALHIIAVISWMAALLYLPRLYVYHCGAEPGSGASEMLKTMERRLLKAIMNRLFFTSGPAAGKRGGGVVGGR